MKWNDATAGLPGEKLLVRVWVKEIHDKMSKHQIRGDFQMTPEHHGYITDGIWTIVGLGGEGWTVTHWQFISGPK